MPRYADMLAFSDEENTLWMTLIDNQDKLFFTMKQLPFQYSIKGNELFVSRKGKSITRATVNRAYNRAKELMESEGRVAGSKKLGTFGASYLYSIFLNLGFIRND